MKDKTRELVKILRFVISTYFNVDMKQLRKGSAWRSQKYFNDFQSTGTGTWKAFEEHVQTADY